MNKKLRYEDLTQEQKKTMNSWEIDELELNYRIRKGVKWGIIGFLTLFAIITFFNSITTVPTGHAGIKTRFRTSTS